MLHRRIHFAVCIQMYNYHPDRDIDHSHHLIIPLPPLLLIPITLLPEVTTVLAFAIIS